MNNTNQNIPTTDFLDQYQRTKNSFSPQWKEIKDTAINNFKALGFPTTKNEEWKYTNVANLLTNKFNLPGTETTITSNDIRAFLPEGSEKRVLVFENGKFNSLLSNVSGLSEGIIAGDLSNHTDHPEVKKYFGKITDYKNESFIALNTAMFYQGAFVLADNKGNSEDTVHLLFINDARLSPTICYPRNLIVVSRGSKLKISESYFSIQSVHGSFSNSVTELYIDEDASLEYCKNESENSNDFHFDSTGAFLQKNSRLDIHTITTGGKVVRNNLRIELQQPNGSAYLNGLYVASGDTHVDNHSVVDHASPHCYSNELYKGVLGGNSKGVFNGKIFVRKDAQKTNAYQSNKNILLSDDASMNAKPQLEIYADDVKCSHGATTGQLDEEALFYLRSRGIGINEAQALLTTAFAEEILDKITMLPTRENLKGNVHSKLKEGNA
jgi:Fe-S cluster assembly protein SufD